MENEIRWQECPICGSKDFTEEHGIGHCKECTHEFKTHVPAVIKQHYYDKQYWDADKNRQGITSVAPSDEWEKWVGSRIRILEHFHLLDHDEPSQVNVLEFGCSEGMVLYELKKRGYQVLGNDVCDIADEAERVLGVPIDRRPIEKFAEDARKFNLIMSFHVMEHLRDPKDVMLRLGGMLAIGGRMLLHVPINDAEYDNPDHFHFFTDGSCRRLMEYVTEDIESDYSSYKLNEQTRAAAATYVGIKK